MVAPTSSHPCAGGPSGLARVTSSLWEKSSLTGSGSPFMKSPSPSWYRSISSSTSFAADIGRDHLQGSCVVLSQGHSLRSSYAIHPGAWNKNSANFAFGEFCELRLDGVLGSSRRVSAFGIMFLHRPKD